MTFAMYRAGLKVGPRLREYFRQVEAEVVSNSRNKIHQTSCEYYSGPSCVDGGASLFHSRFGGCKKEFDLCIGDFQMITSFSLNDKVKIDF